jgi:lactocepin
MTTAALTSLFFTSFTAFAESFDNTSELPSIEEIVEQGKQILVKKNDSEASKDDFNYKEQKEQGLVKPYKPDDLVRLIVEVEKPDSSDSTQKNKRALLNKNKISNRTNFNCKLSKSNTEYVKQRFFEGFNGFSIEIELQNLNEIQSLPGV